MMMIMLFSSATLFVVSPLRRRRGAKALSHEPFHLLEDQSSSLFGLFRRSEGGYQFIGQGFDSCCCCCRCRRRRLRRLGVDSFRRERFAVSSFVFVSSRFCTTTTRWCRIQNIFIIGITIIIIIIIVRRRRRRAAPPHTVVGRAFDERRHFWYRHYLSRPLSSSLKRLCEKRMELSLFEEERTISYLPTWNRMDSPHGR